MEKLIDILNCKGPLIGKELVMLSGMETFDAWRACYGCDRVVTALIGRRYLRLDSKVEGYARLSPSIMREFLNYTVIGLKGSEGLINQYVTGLEIDIAAISESKAALARSTIQSLLQEHRFQEDYENKVCFILAGDVVFKMAHAEPRPESSTGEMVRGSDLDIIIVTDGLSEEKQAELDSLLYREKYNLLMNPASKEEIDYIIKDLGHVRRQLEFTNFKEMVASKILDEGIYLLGSSALFRRIKSLVSRAGVPVKLQALQNEAIVKRAEAEQILLTGGEVENNEDLMNLFYTTEEKEEIF